jgi:hypothetical protein
MSQLVEILQHIGKRPEMYFGSAPEVRSIHFVSAFIAGYQHGLLHPDNSLPFIHFTQWVAARYRVNDGAMGGFNLILDHVGGDDRRAFDEFFRLLPNYIKDMAELGTGGIEARYNEVMTQIHERRSGDV